MGTDCADGAMAFLWFVVVLSFQYTMYQQVNGHAPSTYGWNGSHLAALRAQLAAGTLPQHLHPPMNALRRRAEVAQASSSSFRQGMWGWGTRGR